MVEKNIQVPDNEKFIDIENVVKKKNPALLKILPKFLLNYLKKVVHQDELNSAIYRNKNVYGLDFVEEIINEFGVKIHVINENNIPKKGRFIIASNHPLGGLDGLALINTVGKVRKDIKFVVNDLLLNVENMKSLFIPVNKHGRNSYTNIQTIDEAFASDDLILIFPAGLVSRKFGKDIEDLSWRKSFITSARKHKRDIVPVHIEGKNSNFFYNLSKIRTKLRIRFNIEMFYLVDEMYKQKNKTINITFGEPIPFSTFNKTLKDHQWAAKVKSQVYKLVKKH